MEERCIDFKELRNVVPYSRAHVQRLETDPEYFLFRHKDYFEEQWHVPPVMTDLLEEPWLTTKGDFDISRA